VNAPNCLGIRSCRVCLLLHAAYGRTFSATVKGGHQRTFAESKKRSSRCWPCTTRFVTPRAANERFCCNGLCVAQVDRHIVARYFNMRASDLHHRLKQARERVSCTHTHTRAHSLQQAMAPHNRLPVACHVRLTEQVLDNQDVEPHEWKFWDACVCSACIPGVYAAKGAYQIGHRHCAGVEVAVMLFQPRESLMLRISGEAQ